VLTRHRFDRRETQSEALELDALQAQAHQDMRAKGWSFAGPERVLAAPLDSHRSRRRAFLHHRLDARNVGSRGDELNKGCMSPASLQRFMLAVRLG
jgi:hypothetical protein